MTRDVDGDAENYPSDEDMRYYRRSWVMTFLDQIIRGWEIGYTELMCEWFDDRAMTEILRKAPESNCFYSVEEMDAIKALSASLKEFPRDAMAGEDYWSYLQTPEWKKVVARAHALRELLCKNGLGTPPQTA